MLMREASVLALIVVVSVLSWHVSRYVQPAPPTPQVDTLDVDADAPPDLDEEGSEPDQRIVYRTRTDTVPPTCLSLPQDLPTSNISLVQPLPLQIDGRDVTLTRYDVQAQRYVQDAYRVPRQTWALSPALRTDLMHDTYAVQLGARLTYENLTASVGYRVTPDLSGVSIGIRWTPYTLRW